MTPTLAAINQRLNAVAEKIDAITKAPPQLIAVGKGFDAAMMRPALVAGQRHFGENRVQEAAAKWPQLKDEYPDCHLHLIGPLQTNKAEQAVRLFDTIHTVDRMRLARALDAAMTKINRRPACLIQVNLGEEQQKSGVAPQYLEAFIDQCRRETTLPIIGLMTIPPLNDLPACHFALLAKLARRYNLPELSMGMSGDFETAIAFGATMIRLGTAIFGPRNKP